MAKVSIEEKIMVVAKALIADRDDGFSVKSIDEQYQELMDEYNKNAMTVEFTTFVEFIDVVYKMSKNEEGKVK